MKILCEASHSSPIRHTAYKVNVGVVAVVLPPFNRPAQGEIPLSNRPGYNYPTDMTSRNAGQALRILSFQGLKVGIKDFNT